MKSNKGFTLIELLAVIVILAIIALIATPTILGVIETARLGAAKSSGLGYVDAVEKQYAIDMLETDEDKKVLTIAQDGTIDVGNTTLELKGQAPKAGTVTFDQTKGTILSATLQFNLNGKDYCVTYTGATTTAEAEVMTGESC